MFKIENTKIITYPGFSFNQEYRIDEDGNVWSPYRGWHLVSKQLTPYGYLRVGLMAGNKRKFFMVHRLVMETFNPIKNSLELQVNHKDGNKTNNSLSNLEWCTRMENMAHAKENKLMNPPKGEKVKGSILNEKQVLEICELLKSGENTLSQIGDKYGVTKYCIFDIKRKRSWAWLTKDYNFD